MKNLYSLIGVVALFMVTVQLSAQNCTRALQPVISSITDDGGGDMTIVWDANCGDRDPFLDGQSTCGPADINSVIWYIGIYGQNSPAPNGLLDECDTGLAAQQCAGFPGLPLANGGDYGASCLDPKGSTCTSLEFGQRIPAGTGTLHTWHMSGADIDGDLGFCDAFGGVIINVCPGQCYNVMIWEVIVDQPSGTGTTPDANGNTLPFPGIDANAACEELIIVDESPASPIAVICMSGADAPVANPILTVTSSTGICGASTAGTAFTGTYQGVAEDMGDGAGDNTGIYDGVPCVVQDIDAQIVIDQATGMVDQTIGATGNTGDAGDISVTFTPGVGNSGNGDLTLGAHVVEVNCREDITVAFNTPITCDGIDDLTADFPGERICDDSDGILYSNSKIYISNNGTPVQPNIGGANYPTCDFTTDEEGGALDETLYIQPIGAGTSECASNMGIGYPANFTAQYGAFLSSDDTGDCIRNLVGNPFAGAGVSPFSLEGTTNMDFGDGISRLVSTICVSFEDPCDGSKSATCVKFVSDMSPMNGIIRSCPVTCADATGTSSDGRLIIEDLVGGSPDQDVNADTDGVYTGVYTFLVDGAVTPFTQVAGTAAWESMDVFAPGVYTVDIEDPNAPACGSACDITGTIAILPPPVVTLTATDDNACAGTSADTGFSIDMATSNVVETVSLVQVEDVIEPVAAQPVNAPANGACDDGGIGAPNNGSGQTLTYNVAGVTDANGNTNPTANTVTVTLCFDNVVYTPSTSACGTLNTSGVGIQSPDGALVTWFFLGDAFGGTFTGGLVDGCFDFTGAFPTAQINGTWSIFFADLACDAGCAPVTAGGWTGDDVFFVFEDYDVMTTTAVLDPAACAGASAGTAPADAPVGGYDVTQTSGPTGGITITGSTIDVTYPDLAGSPIAGYPAGTMMCFDIGVHVPGSRFAPDGLDPTCTNMECCYHTTNYCVDITGCTPAELLAFNGEAQEEANLLNWTTGSEINTAKFVVERSIDGKIFIALGSVEAAGNSLTALTYNFTDVNPLTVGYYRLNTIDTDGTNEYSQVVVINRKENGKGIVEIFPIPTDNDVTVQYEVTNNTEVTFTLTDVLGRVVSKQVVSANAGLNTHSIDMINQATGLYFVTFSDGTTEQTRRIVKN